ncbi:stress response translation initiation inhibitor YciH [Psychrosphaera sp. B3R10]|uniref:Stress response translation initiation inhibitor YciH n=1 Tax=Psychrosphaera algicola TaxID=3023714 RepID=A0ABT5FI29_9GAMM|nr:MULTISPECIES: stress response translation initiation inhibitor YciH [unclassified Psychrosphaera]MBU2881555.1 stress response translation initiation inhibitor YciH [Psychrosphaera sp. I2R16]MBU2991190.1 stress response translation initiation inhibitor YciH [Psychrosphaera sp. B3R10]MDC2890846.1 stress response translation initiation inhibitor YciH [Psychrosphaera sp. G1-22]
MADWQNQLSKLVYSTDSGKIEDKKPTNVQVGEVYKDGFVRISRETKGRKGKGVMIITGIQLPADEFKKLAQTLKKKSGTGGAVKDDQIEIQGDDRNKLQSILEDMGYKCKISGG